MKLIRTFILTAIALCIANAVRAADAKTTATWISSLSVAPVGALKTAEITGSSQWGAGVDVGIGLNKFVSLHVVNLAYESDNLWGGEAIDETAVNVEAKLSRFSTESFAPYFLGGVIHSWERDDWGFSAGLGAKIQFNKHLALGADYSVRAFFDDPEDSLARVFLQGSF